MAIAECIFSVNKRTGSWLADCRELRTYSSSAGRSLRNPECVRDSSSNTAHRVPISTCLLLQRKAIQVVGELQGARVALFDILTSLLFVLLAQGLFHSVRQHQQLHMSIRRDLPDNRRGHENRRSRSVGHTRRCIVSNEQICIFCQPRKRSSHT